MKKNKVITIFKIIISIIAVLIVVPIILLIIPIKHVETNIEVNNGKRENLEVETKQIYVQSALDHPGWTVLGKDGIIFDDEDINTQSIFIYGDFPKKINYDLLENTFVLNGKYVGKKEYNGVIAGCFEVESWQVLGELDRKQHNNLSHRSLTGWDYCMAEVKMVREENELKNVE